jgi:hypothetical protein
MGDARPDRAQGCVDCDARFARARYSYQSHTMRALRAVGYLTNALQVRTLVVGEQFAAMRLPGLLSATSLMLLTLQGGIGGIWVKSPAYTRFPSWNAPAVGQRCKLSAPNPRPTISTALPIDVIGAGLKQCAYSRYPMNSDGAPSPTR